MAFEWLAQKIGLAEPDVADETFDFRWLKRKFWWWTLETNFSVKERGRLFLMFGYVQSTEDGDVYRAVAAVHESTEIPSHLQVSSLWRTAEIEATRRKEWLVFSKRQDKLGLHDFASDCSSYLEYLLEEAARYKAVRKED